MPTFDNTPPSNLGRSGYRLIRTPAGHPLAAYVLSDNLLGCKTHFIGNRTIPCEAPNCEQCASGVAWRWHGYLAIQIAATQEVAIFETTAQGSTVFSDYHKRYGTIRGAAFKAHRLNARPNGRVLIQIKPADLAKINLPDPPHVAKLLCHIWNIPPNQITVPDVRPRPPFEDTRIDRSLAETVIPVNEPAQVSSAIEQAVTRAGNNRSRKTK